MDEVMTRHCLKCGKPFEATRDDKVYCCERHRKQSERARWKNARAGRAQKCLYCGRTFVPDRFHPRMQFCSRAHSKAWKYYGGKTETQARAEKKPSKAGFAKLDSPVERVCKTCGKAFQTLFLNASYCSDGCRPSFQRKSRKEIEKTCPVCGNRFSTAYAKKTTCSKVCSRLLQSRWQLWKETGSVLRKGETVEEALAKVGRRLSKPSAAVKRKCRECRRVYVPAAKNQVFCSNACQKAAAARKRAAKAAARKAAKSKLRAAEKAARLKARQEARDEKVLAAHEKRRLMREESLRNRAANVAKHAAMRAASREKAKISRQKRAEAQIMAAIERGKAKEEAVVAKALTEGKEVGYGVCKGCGRDFKFVLNPNRATPEYCCEFCRSHARYVANRDKCIEYGKRYREEKKTRKSEPENLTTYYRGSGFYSRPTGGARNFSEDRALDAMMEQPFSEEEFDQ